MPLVSPLPAHTRSEIERIMSYRNDRISARFSHDYGNRDGADRVFESFKQFMVTCIVTDGRKTASPMIDDMWHTFLLHTRDYRGFCEDFLGGFVEHEPVHDGGAPESYRSTRDLALRLFGELDETCWPVRGKSDCTSDCGDIRARLPLSQ